HPIHVRTGGIAGPLQFTPALLLNGRGNRRNCRVLPFMSRIARRGVLECRPQRVRTFCRCIVSLSSPLLRSFPPRRTLRPRFLPKVSHARPCSPLKTSLGITQIRQRAVCHAHVMERSCSFNVATKSVQH